MSTIILLPMDKCEQGFIGRELYHFSTLLNTCAQHRIQQQGRGARNMVAAFGGHLFYDLFV